MDFVFWALWRRWLSPAWWSASWREKIGKAEFDERQQLARSKAYKAGFYTLLAGLLAVYLIPSLPSGSQRIQPCCPLR